MRLSQAARDVPMEVIRDREFGSLGLISYDGPDMLRFLDDEKSLPELIGRGDIACVISNERLAKMLPADCGLAVSPNPRRSFFEIHNFLCRETEFYGTHFATEVSGDARVHPLAHVAPNDVRIGRRVVVEPRATILERTVIEDDVVVRAGAVIGCQGYQFGLFEEGILAVEHAGGVWLHSNVEVQANTAIARALFGGFTEIGEGTKIGSVVYVDHQAKIGKGTRIAEHATVCGSVTIGDGVWIGPGSVVSSGLRIGDGAQVSIGAVVTRNVAPGQRVSGNFAINHARFIEFLKTVR